MHLNDSFSHLHKLIYCILWRLYTNFALILKQPRIKCRTQLYFYLYAEKLTIGSDCINIVSKLIYNGFHVLIFTFQYHV